MTIWSFHFFFRLIFLNSAITMLHFLEHYCVTMDKFEVIHPISVILSGSNYNHRIESMCGFLKGRRPALIMQLIAIVFALFNFWWLSQMNMNRFEHPYYTRILCLLLTMLFFVSSMKKLDWSLFSPKLILPTQLQTKQPNFIAIVTSLDILIPISPLLLNVVIV